MIPEDVIARVREDIDLVELVREQVPGLKKTGRNFQARCPFHQERTPSFNVNPEMGVFKCFGCGVGGDAFKFLMLTEGLTYPEAIRKLAARLGITIEEPKNAELSEEAKRREQLYTVLEEAARFYHRHLQESSDAAEARRYLKERGLSDAAISKFSLGYAPASGRALFEAATRKGWSTETLESAGLLRRKEDGGRVFDHFWNRIIFPIWDGQGRIIAFGGRAFGDAMPKYINSPETPVYSKSRHLFGLFQGMATLRKRRHAVVLEGYMDVIACHQYGFDYSVATLGTALTEEHVRVLKRYADRITLLFDPDAAGAKATLRGGELLLVEGLQVDVVVLPNDQDADELLLEKGAGALQAELDKPVPFMNYFLSEALKKQPGLSPEAKLSIAREVLPVVRKVRDPLLQDEYLEMVANALRADKAVLGKQLKRIKDDSRERSPSPAAAAPVATPSTILSLEEEMLLTAVLYPSGAVAAQLDGVQWTDGKCREAWDVLQPSILQGGVVLSEVLPQLSEQTQQWLLPLSLKQREYPRPEEMLGEMVAAWRKRQETLELGDLKKDIDRMIEGSIPLDAQKVQIYNDLTKRLKGSKT
jgi:DNA primase